MIDNQDDGVISKAYDKYKESTNSELAKSNVQDVVDKQSQTAEFLQEAKDGKLTYKDYLERKRDTLLSSFPNIDKYNDEQKQKIKQGIDTLDVDTTNRLQQQILALPNKDDAEYKTKAKEFFTEFLNVSTVKTEQKLKNGELSTSSSTTRLKKAYNPSDGDRLMTFEEVFKAEQGVEFNKDNIQKYNESTQQFAYANYLTNKKQEIHNLLDNNLNLANGNNANGANSSTIANSNKQLKTSIYLALSKLYGNDVEKINKGLQELTGENYSFKIKNPNDKLSLNNLELENKSISENSQFKFSTDSQLPTIAKLILDKIDKNTNKAMGGKSLDDYAKTMAEDYKNAYGFRDANALANAFAQDQEGVVQTARNGVQIVGTVVMVGGMAFCPPAALGGGLIASFGGIGVEALNESTKQNASPEKMAELKKEFAQNVALFAVGAGAGKLGSSAKAMLTAKNAPKFVAMIGDIGVDSTVSLIGDLVLTGQLDITGEGFSQVMSLIAGHKGKIVKGVQHLKEKVNDKFRLQSENPNRNIMQMPNGTLVEVKPDGSTVEVKADEVRKNNHNSEQPTEWKKVNIGGEEIEVAMTRDASGNTNVDFSRARKLNADGKYEEFDATTQEHLLADETSTNNRIFKSEEEFKEFLDNEKTSVGNKDKFNADTKKVLIDEFRKNPDLVTTLVTENVVANLKGKTRRRFQFHEIRILLPLLKENPELVNNLIKERTYDSIINDNVPRFNAFQIKDLVSLSKENPESVNNLIKERTYDSKGNNIPRFDFNNIAELAPVMKEYPKEVSTLLKEKMLDSNGKMVDKYSATEIAKLAPVIKECQEEISTLLKEKMLDSNGKMVDKYSATEIAELAPVMKEYPKEVSTLLKEKVLYSTGRVEDKYSVTEIVKLAPAMKKNPEAFSELVNKKIVDNYGIELPEFRISEIAKLGLITDLNLKSVEEQIAEQLKKVKANPEKYVNGEYANQEEMLHVVEQFFDKNYHKLLNASAVFDKEAFNHLLRMRFDDASEYLDVLNNLSDLNLIKQLSNSTNINGKPFMPTQKVEFIDLLKAYKDCGLETTKIEQMVQNGKVDVAQLNIDLFNEIMKKSGLTDSEIATIPKEKLTAWDTKYAHLLSKEIADENDPAFSDLLRAGNLEPDFNAYIHDTSNEYGQVNANTKAMYQENNMNYDSWLKPAKENEVHFVSKDKNTEQLNQIASQVAEDINTLMKTPVKGFLKKQYSAKFFKGDEFVIPQEYMSNKSKLTELVKQLSDTSEQGQLMQVWKRAKCNSTNPDPNRAQTARNTLTILDHLTQRLDDLSNVQDVKASKTLDLTIKMWDRNPQKDIFQGNYSTCCIGMGGGNGSAMPYFVMDTAYNMIELVDNTTGKTIGNALCYMVKGENGRPAFIIDNIEINNGAKPSDEVGKQIRTSMVEYASNVAKGVTGSDDVPIYMSNQYNDVPTSDLSSSRENVLFMGDVNRDDIYMDLYKGWIDKEEFMRPHNVNLLKLK